MSILLPGIILTPNQLASAERHVNAFWPNIENQFGHEEFFLRQMASLTDVNAQPRQPSTAPPFGDCRMCEAQWFREMDQRAEIERLRAKNIACMEALAEGLKQRAKWKQWAMLAFMALGMVLTMAVSGRCF